MAFVVYIAIVTTLIPIYLAYKAQISGLIAKQIQIIVLVDYFHFTDVFFKKSAVILPEYTKININTIDLKKSKLPPYGHMYSLEPIELEILKTYIEINLSTVLSNFLNCLLAYQSYLTRNPIKAFVFGSITNVLIIYQLRTNIHFYFLLNLLIN